MLGRQLPQRRLRWLSGWPSWPGPWPSDTPSAGSHVWTEGSLLPHGELASPVPAGPLRAVRSSGQGGPLEVTLGPLQQNQGAEQCRVRAFWLVCSCAGPFHFLRVGPPRASGHRLPICAPPEPEAAHTPALLSCPVRSEASCLRWSGGWEGVRAWGGPRAVPGLLPAFLPQRPLRPAHLQGQLRGGTICHFLSAQGRLTLQGCG